MKEKREELNALFNEVFEILEMYARAHESLRTDFIEFHSTRHDPSYKSDRNHTEWRFMGALGGGGKFWVTVETFHVNAYPEDMNDVRRAMINKVNHELKPLHKRWVNLCCQEEET